MKPSLESKALNGRVYGIGKSTGASKILYTKVGKGFPAILDNLDFECELKRIWESLPLFGNIISHPNAEDSQWSIFYADCCP